MGKALIYSVEDEANIRELLECAMQASGFDINTFVDAETMLAEFEKRKCDLVLMDIMLPGMDGTEALKIIKSKAPNVPVIMVSAKGSEINKVKAFEMGADDYLAKPFGVLELIARIKARLKKPIVTKIADLIIDNNKHIVSVDGEEVSLTLKEYELLAELATNIGGVVRRDDLLNDIWGIDFDGETRTVDMHIMSLRAKLKAANINIKTVRGVGYILEETSPDV